MKTSTAILLSLGIVATAAMGYMFYVGERRKTVTVTPEFLKDDHDMYTLMRQELITHLDGKYGGWFDDEVNSNYAAGAAVGGKKSKTAAFMKAYLNHSYHTDYAGKKTRFQALYKNLKKRYE